MEKMDNKGFDTEQGKYRLRGRLYEILGEGEHRLIAAPTSLGKTYAIATTPWLERPEMTGGELVIHVSSSRKTRDQAFEMSKKAEGVTPAKLEGREDACPVAAGEYDETLPVPGEQIPPSEWLTRMCDGGKIPFSVAHERLNAKCGRLPCSHDGGCDGVTQWISIFASNDPQYDVLHVTRPFVYNTKLVRNANVIFDEQPDYTVQVKKEAAYADNIDRVTTQNKIRGAVTHLLSNIDSRLTTWEALMAAFGEGNTRALEDCVQWLSEYEPSSSWMFESDSAHALAPAIVRAIINAESLGNGYYKGVGQFRPAEVGLREGKKTEVIVVFDEEHNLKLIHQSPDLSEARCVIGLDAHPTERLWRLQITPEITREELLDSQERKEWRKNVRGLEVYQVGDATRSYTGGWAGNTTQKREQTKAKAVALIEAMRKKFGDDFRTSITSMSLEDDVEQILKDVGVQDPEVLYYGGLKSRDDFKDESVGLLIGCIDPGDENILDKVALLGLHAEVVRKENKEGELERATGRGFTGDDADVATEILESVRKKNVAQAIGRYARGVYDSQTSGAKVFVWSDAIPEDLIDYEISDVGLAPTGKKKKVIEYIQKSGRKMTTTELVAELETTGVNVSREHVRVTLKSLFEQGRAERFTDAKGEDGGYRYSVSEPATSPYMDLEDSIAN